MRIAIIMLTTALAALPCAALAATPSASAPAKSAAPPRPPAASAPAKSAAPPGTQAGNAPAKPAAPPGPPADWQPDAGLAGRLRAAEPAIADWLTTIHVRDPQRERRTLWQFSEDERAIARLRKEDPARIAAWQNRGRLEREVTMLVDMARQAKGPERQAATAKAQARLKDLLAARDQVRTEQLASLHHRVAGMEHERSTGTVHPPPK